MRVADVMSRDVVSVAPETPLREVARLLGEHRVSGLPVVDDSGTCVGIISEADLLPKQVSRPSRREPLEWIFGEREDPDEVRRRAATTAAEAMSRPVVTIGPDRPLREAAKLMVDRRVNRLPVVSDEGLVGIVTRADLVRAYLHLDEEIARGIREEVLRKTMWLDPGRFDIEVREGLVKISGNVDRRSTAQIIERLIGLLDGVSDVESAISWEVDDRNFEPPGDSEPEPGAASITARQPPRPIHR